MYEIKYNMSLNDVHTRVFYNRLTYLLQVVGGTLQFQLSQYAVDECTCMSTTSTR